MIIFLSILLAWERYSTEIWGSNSYLYFVYVVDSACVHILISHLFKLSREKFLPKKALQFINQIGVYPNWKKDAIYWDKLNIDNFIQFQILLNFRRLSGDFRVNELNRLELGAELPLHCHQKSHFIIAMP